jgi:hypothetical protein
MQEALDLWEVKQKFVKNPSIRAKPISQLTAGMD